MSTSNAQPAALAILFAICFSACSGGSSNIDKDALVGKWQCGISGTFDKADHESDFEETFSAGGAYTSQGMINMYRKDADIALMYESEGDWSLSGDVLNLSNSDGFIDAISVGAKKDSDEPKIERAMEKIYGNGLSETRKIKSFTGNKLVMIRSIDGSQAECEKQ